MNMKRLLSTLTAVVMLAAMSTTAFAAEPTMPDKNGNVSIGKDEVTIGIEGRVEPITLAATCNISTYLSIDPNQPESKQFVSPVITVTNDCNAPITLYAASMKATGNAPKVVASDKYSAEGWRQLNKTQTHSNIALGLLDDSSRTRTSRSTLKKSPSTRWRWPAKWHCASLAALRRQRANPSAATSHGASARDSKAERCPFNIPAF